MVLIQNSSVPWPFLHKTEDFFSCCLKEQACLIGVVRSIFYQGRTTPIKQKHKANNFKKF
jgi:hypothetical protein